jgi:hemolysin activation/secretion protein
MKPNWRRPHFPLERNCPRLHAVVRTLFLLLMAGWLEISSLNAAPSDFSNARFSVSDIQVKGSLLLSTNVMDGLFSKYTGTNVSLGDLVNAAADLHAAYCRRGYPMMSVAIVPDQITNGTVQFNVFQTAVPQAVVAGECYLRFTNNPPGEPLSAAELAQAQEALLKKMDEARAAEKIAAIKAADTRIHVSSTNAGPRLTVNQYMVVGNTVLRPRDLAAVLTNIDGAFGTNVSFEGIRAARDEVQRAYSERGYVTVAVAVPQQKLTNATIKIQVTEGRLAAINVIGNRYFSSNNVMRSLPSLHTNLLLNGPIFQDELNSANANPDRQIYPSIGPGPDPGSSALTLRVKDQLPIHGKVDFNDESSPGTPDLRVNTSLVDNNLWQLNHSLGVSYGFSPDQMKPGEWPFYDAPAVANYGTFYRLPLGDPEPVENLIANNPGSFGYDEATHKYNVPTMAGSPSLTVFASRSTIDTGVTTLSSTYIVNDVKGSLLNNTEHQDTTVNQDVGSRINFPLRTIDDFQSSFSGGLDFKTYHLDSGQTNVFILRNGETIDNTPPFTNIVTSVYRSPVPFTEKYIAYLPLAARYDVNWHDAAGNGSLGFGLNGNPWYSSSVNITSSTNVVVGGKTNLVPVTSTITGKHAIQAITGSTESTGNWLAIVPAFSHDFVFHNDWVMMFRADGQWASQPLISNEQYGIGGVNSVRGYHEGRAYGDTGWRVSLEQQTAPYAVGVVFDHTPLTIRGSVYMDYGNAYLLDPQGRPGDVQLWGTGFGLTAAVGSHWQSRFLVTFPLIGVSGINQNQPYFNFGLTAQF